MSDTDSLPALVLDAVFASAEAGLAGAGIDTPTDGWWPGVTHSAPVLPVGWCSPVLSVYLDPAGGIVARPGGERRSDSPGEAQQKGMFCVVVARCEFWQQHPNVDSEGAQPTGAALREAALTVLRGAWAIQVELVRRVEAGELFADQRLGDSFIQRADIGIGNMLPLPWSGQVCGWKINTEVGIPVQLALPPVGS